MPTEITFSGGHSITVEEPLHIVQQNIEQTPYGRPLLRYTLTTRDAGGSLIDVHVNWITIAYVREAKQSPPGEHGRARGGGETLMGGIRDKEL